MISVQQEDFDIGIEYENLRVLAGSPGAIVTFTGLVRQLYEQDPKSDLVESLYLEHYPGMTERKLSDIQNQANAEWKLLSSKIIHRVGELKADDQIVFVGVASHHRKDAFLAAQYMMDFLKSEAPFWKKQRTEKDSKWVDSRNSDLEALSKWR